MKNIVLVQLELPNPNPKDDTDSNGLDVSLVFDDQPTKEDVHRAFCEIPTVNRNKDFGTYSRRLEDCLDTYGVPQLGKFDMITQEGGTDRGTYGVCHVAPEPCESFGYRLWRPHRFDPYQPTQRAHRRH